MLKPTENITASFVLPCSLHEAAAAPLRPDAPARGHAGRFVDVHDSVCADSVLVHQPAQLDEQRVRVGVLLLTASKLFHALGGLLVAQAHATQELLDTPLAGTVVESFLRQAIRATSS